MDYTKGKWEAQQQKNLASGKYEWVIKVQQDDVKSRVIATTPYASKYNDHEANANLIAAAPEMYEALKEARSILNTHYGHHCFTEGQQGALRHALRVVVQVIDKVEVKK
jgi:hypothetical protein